jgi:site-specific DNA recombinase
MARFFLYCRKSLEAEDRQVLSLQSQTGELEVVAKRLDIKILEVLSESRSAKTPGRPVFNDMMKRLRRGEADGILCWKLDRLARNPIDAGTVIWAVNEDGIKIVTPGQTFQKGDESLMMMWLELGMAHKYVVDLSRNIRRSVGTKVGLGWKPGRAGLGYLNHRLEDGRAVIIEDPKRFSICRRMWELLLTRQYSVTAIVDRASNEWGLRGRRTRKRAERPVSKSTTYQMFIDPFYYGEFEYPKGSGQLYKGNHKPMVTKAEFDLAQEILGRVDRARPQKHQFAFIGLIRCGECGAMITAEEKYKRQLNGNIHYYIYYHCTKRRTPRCTQRAITETVLVDQIRRFLATIEISQSFAEWAIRHIQDVSEAEHAEEASAMTRLMERSKEIRQSLDELTRMRYGRLIEDEEFQRERRVLALEKSRLEEEIKKGSHTQQWREEIKFIYDSLLDISARFTDAATEERRGLLLRIGSHLVLKDKKLNIQATEPVILIHEAYRQFLEVFERFAPPENGSTAIPTPYCNVALSFLCKSLNDVRTSLMKKRKEELKKNVGLKDDTKPLDFDLPSDSTIAA